MPFVSTSKRPQRLRQETAQFRAARWTTLLPVVGVQLDVLSWWHEENGDVLCRRDSEGNVRKFLMGRDSESVIGEWLSDWHRRRTLAKCGRLATSLQRDASAEPGIAQGLTLSGVPASTLCRVAGHGRPGAADHCDVPPWRLDSPIGFGGCLCGGLRLSRPHLVWACSTNRDIRGALVAETRLEERLFDKAVPERPAPPVVQNPLQCLRDLRESLSRATAVQPEMLVATDGSAVETVCAWAVGFAGEIFTQRTRRLFAGRWKVCALCCVLLQRSEAVHAGWWWSVTARLP